MATFVFHVLAAAGMGLVAWWLWRDEDQPASAAPAPTAPRIFLGRDRRRMPRDAASAR